MVAAFGFLCLVLAHRANDGEVSGHFVGLGVEALFAEYVALGLQVLDHLRWL